MPTEENSPWLSISPAARGRFIRRRTRNSISPRPTCAIRRSIITTASFTKAHGGAAGPSFPGITTPVPADESAIVSMSVDSFGMVAVRHGGHCGRDAPRRRRSAPSGGADPRGVTGIVHDLGVIPGALAANSVMTTPERVVFIATSGPDGGRIWKHRAIPSAVRTACKNGASPARASRRSRTPFADEGTACAVHVPRWQVHLRHLRPARSPLRVRDGDRRRSRRRQGRRVAAVTRGPSSWTSRGRRLGNVRRRNPVAL